VPVRYSSTKFISGTPAMRSPHIYSQSPLQCPPPVSHAQGAGPDNEQTASQHVTKTNAIGESATQAATKNTDHEGDNGAGQEAGGVQKRKESHHSLDNGHMSSENSSMDQASGSKYVPSQEQESGATEQREDEKEVDKEELDEEEEVEEHVDLEYQIPEDTLRAAMFASPNTRASFWSPKMYRGPDGQSLSTHYCRTKDVAERVAQHFLKEKVVGFDIEWRPFSSVYNIKQNASLIQLACEDRIALFHISLFTETTPEELMPPTLKIILESPDIYKVGVAVKGDFTRLQKYLNIEPQGVFELSRLHNTVEWHATDPKKALSNKLTGLAAQVLQHLQLPLYKGAQLQDDPADTANVRESDWSKPLDLQQIHYAAADAYAGFRLYHIIEWKRKQLRPTPPTRGVCDYDAKAVPREKKSKKKAVPKKSKVADGVVADESASALGQDQEQPKENDEEGTEAEEVDEEENEEAYETAPEEFEDTHELEDPVITSLTEREQVATNSGNTADEEPRVQKCVGRVKLSWLKSSDPGYPVLPHVSEDLDASTSSAIMKNTQDAARSSDTSLTRSDMHKEDDEFADPDLEEALQDLDLDADGKLTETFKSAATATDEDGLIVPVSEAVKPSTTSQAVGILQDTDSGSSTDQDAPDEVEVLSTDSESETPEEPTTSPPRTGPTDETSHSAKYNSASTWAHNYLQSTVPSPKSITPSRIRATVPHLRAYHLWYHQNLSLDDVASELRDPPLSHSTVSGYVLQAVTLEKLEYDRDAMRDMVMGLPIGMRKGRWKWIADKVGASK
jgi:hypothetical protein